MYALFRQILGSFHAHHILATSPLRDSDEYELRLVQVLFRHGARTPITQHTEGQDVFEDFWGECRDPTDLNKMRKCLTGDLTPVGEGQLLRLGTLFREKFIDTGFLNPALDPRQILATSTPSPRTILSCKFVLKGLFPQVDITTLETKEDMTPFASGTTPYTCPSGKLKIYVQPWEKTFILGQYQTNPRLRTLYHDGRNALRDAQLVARQEKHVEAIGLPRQPMPSWIFLADEIACRQGHEKPQREQVTSEMQAEALENARKELLSILHRFSPETLQLGVRPFINQLMMRVASVIKHESPELRCVLYSGHDTSLAPLRAAFGFDAEEWPPFASYLMWELLQKKATPKSTLASVLSAPFSSSSTSISSSHTLDPHNEWAVRVTWNGKDSFTVPLNTLQQSLVDKGFVGPVEIEAMSPDPPPFEWGWAPHQLGDVPIVPK